MKGPASPEAAPRTPLHGDADRNSNVGISAVVHVIAVVRIGDINVVVVIPVIPPVFRPWVHETDPVALILETRVPTHNHEGQAVDVESMVLTKISTVAIVRNAVALISATLLPIAMVGIPVLRAVLLPRALLNALLFLSALRTFIAPLLLGVSLLIVLLLPWRLLSMLLLTVLLPPWRLLGMLLLVVPVLLLRLLSMLLLVVLFLPLLLLGMLLLVVPVLLLRLLSMLLLVVLLLPWRLLSVLLLLFRFGLVVLALLLLRMILFFALLLLLCIGRSRNSEKQRKNGCAGNSNYSHQFRLLRLYSATQHGRSPSLFIGSPPVS